jgi:hypothetical protein
VQAAQILINYPPVLGLAVASMFTRTSLPRIFEVQQQGTLDFLVTGRIDTPFHAVASRLMFEQVKAMAASKFQISKLPNGVALLASTGQALGELGQPECFFCWFQNVNEHPTTIV